VLRHRRGGFVGPHLVATLVARGARVRAANSCAARGTALEGWVEADLADRAACESALAAAPFDAVVHLAGQSSAARSFEAPEETFRANVTGTWTLLEAVRTHATGRARAGRGHERGLWPHRAGHARGRGRPVRAGEPVRARQGGRRAGGARLSARARADSTWCAPGRSGIPGRADAAVRDPVVRAAIAAIEAGRAEPVLRVGNLEVTRDLSDVRDIVAGYVALLERGRNGGVYNLCRGEGVSLTDVVAVVGPPWRAFDVRIEVDPARLRPADTPWLVGDPGLMERT
jgi:GDP-4-dehydro-6-deoxy-D-mannose reductase